MIEKLELKEKIAEIIALNCYGDIDILKRECKLQEEYYKSADEIISVLQEQEKPKSDKEIFDNLPEGSLGMRQQMYLDAINKRDKHTQEKPKEKQYCECGQKWVNHDPRKCNKTTAYEGKPNDEVGSEEVLKIIGQWWDGASKGETLLGDLATALLTHFKISRR